jgi:hypothetical protein
MGGKKGVRRKKGVSDRVAFLLWWPSSVRLLDVTQVIGGPARRR